jgi:formylmethanofuran dehydrogenase subunit A
LTCISGGRVIDPANGRDGVGDLWIRDERIVAPEPGECADETHDAGGKVVMAGGIDIHSHIAGENVNASRLLLPEQRRDRLASPPQAPFSRAVTSTFATGCQYAVMGFTTVVEPAISPHAALQAQLELADIPIIDKAILAVLGNDDFLLRMIRRKESADAIRDYVAWTVDSSRALGIKVINAGGAAALKANVRTFSLDDVVPFYGVTSREIVTALQRGVNAAGIPHPLHVHCNNLGLAGNAETALATIAATEEWPVHLAHLQFYGYGREGPRGFSSAAARLAETLNASRHVTIDVGQVMFGQTVTVSSDVLLQFNARQQAHPRKWLIMDGDANGGGVVPYNYRPTSFHNAVQWAVGLELFLLIADPGKVFFTTDHPNGAPFTKYPEILALLMDRRLRAEVMSTLPPEAMEMTTLGSIEREYSLYEVATMTRSAPARLLGLADRGHLGAGALADVAVYSDGPDRAQMFRAASLVFKNGELVVRNGEVTRYRWGRALHVRAEHDRAIDARLNEYYGDRYGLSPEIFKVREHCIGRPEPFEPVPCRS